MVNGALRANKVRRSTQARRLSQGNGLCEDALAHARVERGLGDHVDLGAEEVGEVHEEAAEVEQAAVRGEVDQEVDVTPGVGVATSDRTEHADVARSSPGGDGFDVGRGPSQCLHGHGARRGVRHAGMVARATVALMGSQGSTGRR